MKTMKFWLCCLLASVATLCRAQGGSTLKPQYCTLTSGSSELYAPLNLVQFSFGEEIEVAPAATAFVYDGDQIVATSQRVSRENYNPRPQGLAIISFDNVKLTKGRKYTLVVPQGTIRSQANPQRHNQELRESFTVPETLKFTETYPSGSIATEEVVTFFFTTEIKALGTPEATLYREGEIVRRLPVKATYDWDLGQAIVYFGESTDFEHGVHYSILLPRGSVSALHRDDITNEELRMDFVGAYKEPARDLMFVWCSLFGLKDFGRLNEVYFVYNEEIIAAPNATLQLYELPDKLIASPRAAVRKEGNRWLLFADFGGIELTPGKGYSIVIPKRSIKAIADGVLVRENSVGVNVGTGLASIDTSPIHYTCLGNVLRLSQLPPRAEVSVFTVDGVMVARVRATSSTLELPLPACGVFVVSIGGSTYKVVNQ
ncbi:MAG: hypothetical protein Q4A64_00435 [Porphyromonadaceae bacterium]|nr:hypothetical protein [Porphyromonadaceae bacterium]